MMPERSQRDFAVRFSYTGQKNETIKIRWKSPIAR
jgi:hypothetical protein